VLLCEFHAAYSLKKLAERQATKHHAMIEGHWNSPTKRYKLRSGRLVGRSAAEGFKTYEQRMW
jgi:hypothetical protein